MNSRFGISDDIDRSALVMVQQELNRTPSSSILRTGVQLFSDKIKPENVELHLIQGKDEAGTPSYAFVATYPHLARQLKIALVFNKTELSKYGVVLATGTGEPTDEVRQQVEKAFFES